VNFTRLANLFPSYATSFPLISSSAGTNQFLRIRQKEFLHVRSTQPGFRIEVLTSIADWRDRELTHSNASDVINYAPILARLTKLAIFGFSRK